MRSLAKVVLASAFLGTLCSSGQAGAPTPTPEARTPGSVEQLAATSPSKVTISNFTFSPAILEVPAGTAVVFANEDDVPHTVLGSDPGSPLKSHALDTDDRYAVVMSRPGTYRYFCTLHPHMTGTVVVD
jgi:plastocyanin